MGKHVMVVLTNAADGRDAEFNEWYDKVHLVEVLEAEGIQAARRYRLSDAQIMDEKPYRYLALYEIDGDPKEVIESLEKRSASMNMSDSMAEQALANVFSPIGDRVVSK